MKVAVTYGDGEIFQRFGHCSSFKVYEIEDNQIKNTQVVEVTVEGHDALGAFLKAQGVNAVICGGMGAGARGVLGGMGIAIYGGQTGSADQAVQALLAGRLQDIKKEGHGQCGGHGQHHEHKHHHAEKKGECCGEHKHHHEEKKGECCGEHKHHHAGRKDECCGEHKHHHAGRKDECCGEHKHHHAGRKDECCGQHKRHHSGN